MGVAAVWVMIGGFRSDWVTGGDVLALSSLAVGVWEATSNSLAGKMNQISKCLYYNSHFEISSRQYTVTSSRVISLHKQQDDNWTSCFVDAWLGFQLYCLYL